MASLNKQVSDGMLIESSGPIPLSQAAVLIASGAGASHASGMLGGHSVSPAKESYVHRCEAAVRL